MLLEYQLRTGTLNDNTKALDLFSVSTHEYYADTQKVEVRVEHTSDITIYPNEALSVTNIIDREDEFGERYPVAESDEMTVIQSDNILKTFSFIADKYHELKLDSVWMEVEANVLFVHFSFLEWHYFRSWETHEISFTVNYPNGENVNGSDICFENCQYVSDMELKWRYDANAEGIEEFLCSVFGNDEYKFVGFVDNGDAVLDNYVEVSEIPETACFTDEMHLKIHVNISRGSTGEVFILDNGVEYPVNTEDLQEVYVMMSRGSNCDKWLLYDKQCNDSTLIGVTAKRLGYKYQNVNDVEIYVTIPLASVLVPLSLSTGNNTYQEQNINEKFVRKQFEASKNNSVEMEKLVYHPVFKVEDKNGLVSYKPIHKIKFNLHFRERDEEGWIVKTDGLWNGMHAGNDSYIDGTVYDNDQTKFFSYVDNSVDITVDGGRQSDLLCYLGFNNADIKYQKSRLKKSFLRLSFYDSPNRANQNLLCYSTVFMDSGKLFTKMMRGANRKKRYVISGTSSNVLYDDLKVNTEPTFDNNGHDVGIEEVEQFRLSSQIVVSDRLSDASSEGFYLYLWADNDNGALPSDIYMRVDFNHAGYGRVVPMTMPYMDNSTDNAIFTFVDIFNKWTNNVPNGWGIRANEKYSYIHFKYVYDSDNRQHVYYLDPDTYGLSSYGDATPDELELNLYEPKINFE